MDDFEASIVIIFGFSVVSYFWGYSNGFKVNKKRADDYMTTIKSLIMDIKGLKAAKDVQRP